MSKLKIKTGDSVVIISGRDKGKSGKVMAVSPKEGKVIVEGCNLISKHVKPKRAGEAGGIVQAESAIYVNKVMIQDPETKKPVRVGFKTNAKGEKVRYTVGRNASGKEV